MPTLDFSSTLLSPSISSRFAVTRREERVNDFGLLGVVPALYPSVVGVVNMAGPNDLQRLDDSDHTGRVISIVTKFKLRGTSPGYKPDVILWKGDYYTVIEVDPYPQYGAGFVQALAGSRDYQDQPPLDNPPGFGQYNYLDGRQSPLIMAR